MKLTKAQSSIVEDLANGIQLHNLEQRQNSINVLVNLGIVRRVVIADPFLKQSYCLVNYLELI
jgi:hypothetical protein